MFYPLFFCLFSGLTALFLNLGLIIMPTMYTVIMVPLLFMNDRKIFWLIIRRPLECEAVILAVISFPFA